MCEHSQETFIRLLKSSSEILNSKLSNFNAALTFLQITLSLAPEEKLSKAALTDTVEDCAKQLGFEESTTSLFTIIILRINVFTL